MCRFAFVLLCCLFHAGIAQTQGPLLSPEDYLPHPYGRQFTPHHLLTAYVEYVAAKSDRVELLNYGDTPEGRPLLLAFVSSPSNLARLETIRQNNLKRAGFLDGTPDESSPVAITWLSFGVHGNEAGAAESSMALLYALADPANATTSQYLENTLVILDPSVNPDGYNRYTNWYRQVAPLEADPLEFTREHQEPWPGGRENHYLFDLNRDWAWATQSETRDRLTQYLRWLPHVHADFHEQYPEHAYFFAPGAEPFHPAITQWQRDFQVVVGKNNARYFDQEGWLYYTRETFDLFYPGYGDTYPTFAGAIGMTYEQGGHGVAGRAIELENGEILTLSDRIAHHTVAALATIEAASRHAGELVRQFQAFYDRSRTAPPGSYRTFVVRATNGASQMDAFTHFLDMHSIRYGKAAKRQTVDAYQYLTGETRNVVVSEDDLVVSAFQPAGVMAQILLEPSAFLFDSLTYDITAWSAIHSFGLDALALEDRLEPGSPWQAKPYTRPEWPAQAPFAYILPWTSLEDARFLGNLLKEGIVVRVATQEFRIAGRDFEPGALLVTRADNNKWDGYHLKVQELAEAYHRNPVAVQTGFSESGADLGSDAMRLIRIPKIAVISGDPVDPDAFGAVWYYFEQVLQYPVSILDAATFRTDQLEGMDVLVLPDGNYASWEESGKSRLAEWLRAGGRVVGVGRALSWLQQVDGVHLAATDLSVNLERPEGKTPEQYGDRERSMLSSNIPGAVFKATLDNSHPMGFGFPGYYFTLKRGSQGFAFLRDGENIAYLGEDPLSFGFVGSEAARKLENTLVFGAEHIGKGSAIYLVDDPLFRGFWQTGRLLFANAVFFGGL